MRVDVAFEKTCASFDVLSILDNDLLGNRDLFAFGLFIVGDRDNLDVRVIFSTCNGYSTADLGDDSIALRLRASNNSSTRGRPV